MVKINDIIKYVESLSGHSLRADEGMQRGREDVQVQKVTVCWMASKNALENAGKIGSDLVIAHECLYHPYNIVQPKDSPGDWRKWLTNRQRTNLLKKYNLNFVRIHGSLDEICIFDDFAAMLELGEAVEAEGLVKVYQISPCTLEDLVTRVKEIMEMDTLRVSAPQGMKQKVKRVGLPWGGLGLDSNVHYQQRLIEKGCDVFIAGECDEHGFHFSAECSIPMIETSHVLSENPGLKHFTQMLKDKFPGIEVKFYENTCPWVWR